MASPSHYSVFDYWKDKRITRYGTVVPFTTQSRMVDDSVDVVGDWGEPECWCCGEWVDLCKIPEYNTMLSNGNTKKIWQSKEVTSKLQRCHIVPKSLGGTYSPSNMFLMCERCHRESPDHLSQKYFLQFVYATRKHGRIIKGYREEELMRLLSVYDVDDKIVSLMGDKKATLEEMSANDDNMGIHIGKIPLSSVLALAVDAVKNGKRYQATL